MSARRGSTRRPTSATTAWLFAAPASRLRSRRAASSSGCRRAGKKSANNPSTASLKERRSPSDRGPGAHGSGRKPRVEKLNDVLAGLGDARRETNGTWLRFKRWLRELLERRDREDREDWFD